MIPISSPGSTSDNVSSFLIFSSKLLNDLFSILLEYKLSVNEGLSQNKKIVPQKGRDELT